MEEEIKLNDSTSNESIEKKTDSSAFTLRMTNIAKGIAILCLLYHHFFFYRDDGSLLMWSSVWFARICVPIFLFLSGYGLSVSFKIYINKTGLYQQTISKRIWLTVKFVFIRLMKLMSRFWIVYVLFFAIGNISGLQKSNEIYNSFFDVIVDIAGLAGSNRPTLTGAWWYLSAIIPLYMLFPVYRIMARKVPAVFVVLFIYFILFPLNIKIIYEVTYNSLAFFIGIIFFEYGLFEKIGNNCKTSNLMAIRIIMSVAIILIYYVVFIRDNDPKIQYLMISLATIEVLIIVYLGVSKIKYLSSSFEFLGKLSANVFFFHALLNIYYATGFLGYTEHTVWTFLIEIVLCIIISIGINYLYDIIWKLISFVKRKICNNDKKTDLVE